MLQTFPRNYKFLKRGEQVTFSRLGRMIGNAVPVRLGEVIGKCLAEHVRAYESGATGVLAPAVPEQLGRLF